MKSKNLLTSVLAIATLALTACGGGNSSEAGTSSTAGESTVDTSSAPAEKVTLNMSVYYDNNDRHMKFIEGTSAKLPYTGGSDRTTYKAGDFKPVWKAIQKNLGFTINDVSPTGKVTIKDNFTTLVSSGFKANDVAVDIAQGNSDQILSEGTTNGTILNLKEYLNKMPNFNKFLNDNPSVKKTITSAEGKIFYAPYFDGFDDIERMIMVRQDWVEKLLDGEGQSAPEGADTTAVVKGKYTPFYAEGVNSTIKVLNRAFDVKDGPSIDGTAEITKTIPAEKNIIKQMNDAESLTGASSIAMLRKYIDEVYGTTYGTKRSELFVGGRAVYDIDELVALMRCVKANAKFLTGVADAEIIPFFPRAKTSDRTTDLYRFLQFFGIRGTESRKEWMYVDNDGKLVDARGTEAFANGLERLHQMYEEGLIMKDFTTAQINNKDDYRGPFLSGGEGAKQFGFATYDYNQTTTVYNDSTKIKDMKFVSLMPAVADWDDGTAGNLVHYTESWRSVKPQGWFINKNIPAKKLDKALELFDYLYSDEGNRVMSYGPDAYLAKKADGSIETIDYQGKQVPKLSDACKKELTDLTGGNYTDYYRIYLGATLPVGYVKEQGMEYQCVSTKATPALNVLNKAIQYGVLDHVNHLTNNTKHINDIVPTTLPFTKSEEGTLGSNFTDLNTAFTSDKKKIMTISKVVIGGWDTYDTFDFSSKQAYLNTINTTFKLNQMVTLYNDAYTRYLSL